MITKSDLATAQANCNHTNGNGAALDTCGQEIESHVHDSTNFGVSPNDIKLKITRQKAMLCNGHGDNSAFKASADVKENHSMETTATNGRYSPIPKASGSKDSGFSTPAPSTSGSSRTVTPSNCENQEPMETMESTLATIVSTPLKAASASYSASIKPCTASNIIENEIDEDKNDVFYFESDHAALRGNLDFQNLLKTVTLLESQRTKAINDLDKLIAVEKEALNDPINFAQKLQQKTDAGIPPRLNVAALPKIQWDKYTSNVDPLNIGKHKHMTRNKKLPKYSTSSKASYTATSSSASNDQASTTVNSELNSPLTVIRGRVKDDGKSETFNKLWTSEEQLKLEELLFKYPAEEVEAKRWSKIATELGTRTPHQVQSRVQKYFIKLAKAGIPVPGRMPNVQTYNRKSSSSHRHRRYNHLLHQPSTFLSSHAPPVYMNEVDDDDMISYAGSSFADIAQYQSTDTDSDDDIPAEIKVGEEYQELIRLRRLRREKMKEEGQARHIGFKCDRCDCDPIVGTRWHCTDCPQDMSTDFCSNCFDSQFQTESHNSSHRLEMITVQHTASSTVDTDYTKFMHRGYNYLDPNYMPAS